MQIGRVQRRFTAEPVHSPVPGAEPPLDPVVAVDTVEAVEHEVVPTMPARPEADARR